ncbi:hypothetical protein Zmor_001952 [Zophobas morio]|uniref:Uncharacterized protein n=1 Tax=Zophobas morio TaxID=2755281 RepID=A0AA38J3I1_9CUCU|nr:hypothetical protein Zmor_001952 [Zophobas morio]
MISSSRKYLIDQHCGTPLHKKKCDQQKTSRVSQTSMDKCLANSFKKIWDVLPVRNPLRRSTVADKVERTPPHPYATMFAPETGLISQSKPANVFSVAFSCHHHHHHRSVNSQDTPFTAFANLLWRIVRAYSYHVPEYTLSAQVHTMPSSLINTLRPNALLLSLNPSPVSDSALKMQSRNLRYVS